MLFIIWMRGKIKQKKKSIPHPPVKISINFAFGFTSVLKARIIGLVSAIFFLLRLERWKMASISQFAQKTSMTDWTISHNVAFTWDCKGVTTQSIHKVWERRHFMPQPANLLDLSIIEQKLLGIHIEPCQSGINKNIQRMVWILQLSVPGSRVLWLCLHRVVIVGDDAWRLSLGWISEAGVVSVTEDALDPGENPCWGHGLVGEVTWTKTHRIRAQVRAHDLIVKDLTKFNMCYLPLEKNSS